MSGYTPTRSMKLTVQAFKPDDNAMPKEEYQKKWDAFKSLFAKTPEGKTKKLRARVTRVFGPVPIAEIFKGQGKITDKYILTAVLNHKGVNGLKISGIELTASLDPKAKFNALYYAATGEAPEGATMDVHPGIVGIRDVMMDIKREGARSDGKQAGFWFKAVDFEPVEVDGEIIPQALEDYDAIWVEPTQEEWDGYRELAEASIVAKKRIRRQSGYQPRSTAPGVDFEKLVQQEQAQIRSAQSAPDVEDDEAPWADETEGDDDEAPVE